MRLGYACAWWRPIETTWSGTSASLMNALIAQPGVELERIDVQHSLIASAALAAWGKSQGYANWKYTPASRWLTDRRVRRRIDRRDLDAVIGVADVHTVGEAPTFLYHDANFSVIRGYADVIGEYVPDYLQFPQGRLDELVAEQSARYAEAAGVLSFSQWFADWLVEHDGVPRERVHVVGGGLHGTPARRSRARRGDCGTKVLFIGREFFRKGGDLVVEAIRMLRASGSGDFTLTVVGPAQWPLPGPIPPWVDFRGELPAAEVRQMWADHDLFAMPTWYEPYGLVFLEARAAGVPALGREVCCMPELVPSSAGRLISAQGRAEAVADALASMSVDAYLFATAEAGADQALVHHTWDGVATRTVSVVESFLEHRV